MTPRRGRPRTVAADRSAARGRLGKAQQFLRVAEDARLLSGDDEIGDAAVTLYVHAGIAAADAICAMALGEYAKGENHQDAVALLASVDQAASTQLSVLLGMKTRAGYGHDPISGANLARAARAAVVLVERATLGR